MGSRPTWCHTHVSTSLWPPTRQSSPLRRPTTNSSPSLRSPTCASSQPTRWSSATHVTASTWRAACFTVVMSCQRMSTPPLPPSRPSEPSSSSTGAQPASRSASTTSRQPSSQAVTWPRSSVPSACFPTPPPSPKHGPDLTTSSTSCTPSVPLCTGTSVKVWKKANSPKPVKTLPPSRRTTKKSASTLPKVKAKEKKENTKALIRISVPRPLFLQPCNQLPSLFFLFSGL